MYCHVSIKAKSATRVTRVKFTLATLASFKALIFVKIARNKCTKMGNMLSNLKGSCKSKWALKKDSTLSLHLEIMNETV